MEDRRSLPDFFDLPVSEFSKGASTLMEPNFVEIRIEGKTHKVPAICVDGRTIIVTGRWLKLASVQDELFLEGEPVSDPEFFVREIKARKLRADVFAFSQKLTDNEAKYRYPREWDNAAAVTLNSYETWWERIPQESRKNVRRASKRGVIVKSVELNDEFIQGVMEIYNESPIRQGMRFWHYGKDFATVKMETATFPDNSEFIGAYFHCELIGFIKVVYLGQIAALMAIVSKNSHHDKRPTNALIAKAIAICCSKKCSHLVYGKYTYGNKTDSPLQDFKRRNGFEEVRFPRYHVPLTWKGRIAVKMKLHLGLSGLLPARVIAVLVNLRSRFLTKIMRRRISRVSSCNSTDNQKETSRYGEQYQAGNSADAGSNGSNQEGTASSPSSRTLDQSVIP
jgi:hypothetical protein